MMSSAAACMIVGTIKGEYAEKEPGYGESISTTRYSHAGAREQTYRVIAEEIDFVLSISSLA